MLRRLLALTALAAAAEQAGYAAGGVQGGPERLPRGGAGVDKRQQPEQHQRGERADDDQDGADDGLPDRGG